MNKNQFLNDLKRNLKQYPKDFVIETIDYYSEAIADGMEDGLTEEESIKRLGKLPDILESIKENAKATEVKEVNNNVNGLNLVLVLLLFPFWLPIVIVFFVVLWALAFASCVFEFALGISGLALTFSSFGNLFTGLPGAFGLNFGVGLGLIGITILLFFLVVIILKWVLKINKKFFYTIKEFLLGGK